MSKAKKLSGFDFARLADVRALKPGLLYPYQSDGVAFFLSKKRAVLGDDMGLGKRPIARCCARSRYTVTADRTGR